MNPQINRLYPDGFNPLFLQELSITMLSVAPKTDPTNESGEKTTPAPETKPKPLDLKNDSDFGASGTGVFGDWVLMLLTPGMKHNMNNI